MRDVSFVPLGEGRELVISSDNAAFIGEKEADEVKAPYEVVAEALFRVAYMENRAVGADPVSVILYDFSGGEGWRRISGAIEELGKKTGYHLPVTGSTESNFPLPQSAFAIAILGQVNSESKKVRKTPKTAKFAVIGEPLVGEEVRTKRESIAPLHLFDQLLQLDGVYEVLPVGSKGIAGETRGLLEDNNLLSDVSFHCDLDIEKSGGPATCFVVTYKEKEEARIRACCKGLFHPLYVS